MCLTSESMTPSLSFLKLIVKFGALNVRTRWKMARRSCRERWHNRLVRYAAASSSQILQAAPCPGTERDANKLNKLVRKVASVIGRCESDSLEAVMEKRMLSELVSVLRNVSHRLEDTPGEQRSVFRESDPWGVFKKEAAFLLVNVKLFHWHRLCPDTGRIIGSQRSHWSG